MSRVLSEQKQRAVTGKIRDKVAAKVSLLGEKFLGLGRKIQGLLDGLKELETSCVKTLVSRSNESV